MNKILNDSEILAKGQQVITACALIHHNFDGIVKVFLPKRASTKKFLPNIFELPGGHLDFGEDIVEGLKREIMEEFGMRISVGDSFASFTYLNEIKRSHSVEVVYFATFIEAIEKVRLNPEDHSEYKWFSESDLDDLDPSDKEFNIIKKGLDLLDGQSVSFG